MSLVKFSDVGLRYSTGAEVLHDLNFEIENGTFHYLTGPSGAGKTSLMKLFYLGKKPTRGIISMFGNDLTRVKPKDMPEVRRQIGVVFQDFRLLNHMSVFDNVALPLRVAGINEQHIKRNVTELLNWVGLGDRISARPPTLSGGEQQRIAIARAVINRPKLLLADEPTGSIDENMGMKLMSLFENLNRHGTTVIIATHNEDLVRRFPHPRMKIENGSVQMQNEKGVRVA